MPDLITDFDMLDPDDLARGIASCFRREGINQTIDGWYTDQSGKYAVCKGVVSTNTLNSFLTDAFSEEGLNGRALLVILQGSGNTELHASTLYIDPKHEKFIVFDPKVSDPQRFLNNAVKPNFSVINLVKAISRNLFNWAYARKVKVANREFEFNGLGAQSFFDGTTCGLHSLGMVKLIADMFDQAPTTKPTIDARSLKKRIASGNSVQTGLNMVNDYQQLENDELITGNRVRKFNLSNGFLLKKAWKQCYPGNTGVIKAVAKFFTELPLAMAAALLNIPRSYLMARSPTHWYSKIPRSLSLLLFQAAYQPFNIASKGFNRLYGKGKTRKMSGSQASSAHLTGPSSSYVSTTAGLDGAGPGALKEDEFSRVAEPAPPSGSTPPAVSIMGPGSFDSEPPRGPSA